MSYLFITCFDPFTGQKCFTCQTTNGYFLTLATTHVTCELNNLAITMNQGARGNQTRWHLQRPAATHWSSLSMDPILTWDHSGDTASTVMTVSHHHWDGNLIPLLPCYHQLDFDCFVDKVGNLVPDEAVIFINDFLFKYHEASYGIYRYPHTSTVWGTANWFWYIMELPSTRSYQSS